MDTTEGVRVKGLAAIAAISVTAITTACGLVGPERSVDSFCETWKEEGEALHQKWKQQNDATKLTGNPFGGIGVVAGAFGDLEGFFGKLEEVAPDAIQDDVATLQDGYGKMNDAVGRSTSPLDIAAAGLMLGLQIQDEEQRVSTWTQSNCDPDSIPTPEGR